MRQCFTDSQFAAFKAATELLMSGITNFRNWDFGAWENRTVDGYEDRRVHIFDTPRDPLRPGRLELNLMRDPAWGENPEEDDDQEAHQFGAGPWRVTKISAKIPELRNFDGGDASNPTPIYTTKAESFLVAYSPSGDIDHFEIADENCDSWKILEV